MIVFDLEANGLVHDCTEIHCIVLYDTNDDQTVVYNNEGGDCDPLVRAVTRLDDADSIVGHNIISYDLRVIKKLYPFFDPKGEVVDTLILFITSFLPTAAIRQYIILIITPSML